MDVGVVYYGDIWETSGFCHPYEKRVEPQGEPQSVPAVEMQDEDGNTFFAQPVPVLDEGGDPVKDEDGNIVLETDENGNIVVETDTDGNVVHAEVILDENEVPMVVVEELTDVVEVLVLPFTEVTTYEWLYNRFLFAMYASKSFKISYD